MAKVQMHSAEDEAHSSAELWEVQAGHRASIADRRIDGCHAPAAVSLYRGKPQLNTRRQQAKNSVKKTCNVLVMRRCGLSITISAHRTA